MRHSSQNLRLPPSSVPASLSDWQFLLKELIAVTFVVGVAAGICQQGPQAAITLAVAAIPLSGPGLILWGSIFEHRWLESLGAGITLCAPVLLFAAVLLPAWLGA
jgi:hypothetical protein